jgi:hypothetical protein
MFFGVAVQPIDVPATLIALATLVGAITGLVAMWVSLKAKLDAAIAVAQASVDRTAEGNAVLDKVHGLIVSKADEAKAQVIADLRQQAILAAVAKAIPAPVAVPDPTASAEPIKVIVDNVDPLPVVEVEPGDSPRKLDSRRNDPLRAGFRFPPWSPPAGTH